MPSNLRQKAEKKSRQSDVMSDMENLVVMLGIYSINAVDSQLSENEENMDRSSNERQTNGNQSGDDFRTLLNTNSVGNSDITSETVRMISSDITNQVSSKMNEFKVILNLHNRETVEKPISDQVLPTIRETLGKIRSAARPNVDLTSSERHRSPEMHCRKKGWENIPELNNLLVIKIITILRTHLSLMEVKKITTKTERCSNKIVVHW